jgi:hypothetical protein
MLPVVDKPLVPCAKNYELEAAKSFVEYSLDSL